MSAPAPTGLLMNALANASLANNPKDPFVGQLLNLFSELPEPGHRFYNFGGAILAIEENDTDFIEQKKTKPRYTVLQYIRENPHVILKAASLAPYVRPPEEKKKKKKKKKAPP